MVIIRLLHVIDWHRGESVYTRKVLRRYDGCLNELGCLNRLEEEV